MRRISGLFCAPVVEERRALQIWRQGEGESARPPYHVDMNVTLNGAPHPLPEPCTIESLLAGLDLGQATCAVEVNANLVPKRDHAGHELTEGDEVEVVTLVGGG